MWIPAGLPGNPEVRPCIPPPTPNVNPHLLLLPPVSLSHPSPISTSPSPGHLKGPLWFPGAWASTRLWVSEQLRPHLFTFTNSEPIGDQYVILSELHEQMNRYRGGSEAEGFHCQHHGNCASVSSSVLREC